MNKIITIAKKELLVYFTSPVAYIILLLTLTLFNLFFFLIIDGNREATLRDIFQLMKFLLVFIVPLLTMKTFSEEKQNGTMEFLMTTPTTNTQIVLGKYLGSLLFFSILIFLTLPYYFIISTYATIDVGATWLGYFGVWIEGAMYIAIGVMTSAWTKNQIVAAITAYMFTLTLYFIHSFEKYIDGSLDTVLRYIGTLSHAENFSTGLISSSDSVYYTSIIVLCLIWTRLSIETRKSE